MPYKRRLWLQSWGKCHLGKHSRKWKMNTIVLSISLFQSVLYNFRWVFPVCLKRFRKFTLIFLGHFARRGPAKLKWMGKRGNNKWDVKKHQRKKEQKMMKVSLLGWTMLFDLFFSIFGFFVGCTKKQKRFCYKCLARWNSPQWKVEESFARLLHEWITLGSRFRTGHKICKMVWFFIAAHNSELNRL